MPVRISPRPRLIVAPGLSVPIRATTTLTRGGRIRELEREVRRKDRALAETAALLVLSRKLEAVFSNKDKGEAE